MKKSLSIWQITGFIFTGIFGVILHFLYNWNNQSIIVAPFSAINESIWEHMKLLFFPMFVFALFEKHYIDQTTKNFWCIKLIAIVIGTILIPVFYYTINGIFGMTPDWINILIFFVTAAISYFIETQLLVHSTIKCTYPSHALFILLLITFLFIIFTFIPPHIPLFADPITNTYGI